MLFMVTDYSLRGLRALRRIHGMLGGLDLKVKDLGIIVTRGPEQLSEAFLKEVEEIGVPIVGVVPDDPALLEYDMEKKSLLDLPDSSPSVMAIQKIMDKNCPA
jgi:CO dehydrogenase maturation factor